MPHREALPRLPPSQTPAASPLLPETSLLSKGGGKPWAFRSDWSSPASQGEAVIGCRALSVAEARAFAGEAQPGSGASAAAAAAQAGAAGRARAGAAASAAAHPAAPPALPVLQADAGEGRPRERSTRRWRRRRSDAGAGDGAAAAEQQHLRDPGCSVPVARGPAERPETTRPTGKVRPGGTRTGSGTTGVFSSYEAHCARAFRQGCLGPGQRVRTHG